MHHATLHVVVYVCLILRSAFEKNEKKKQLRLQNKMHRHSGTGQKRMRDRIRGEMKNSNINVTNNIILSGYFEMS